MGMENELSFLEGEVDFFYGELQEAQWQLHAANRELQQLRADADRRRQRSPELMVEGQPGEDPPPRSHDRR